LSIQPGYAERVANAASIAGLLLTTEALVTEIPEKGKLLRCHRAEWAAMDY